MNSSFEFNAPQNAGNLVAMIDEVDEDFFDAVDEVSHDVKQEPSNDGKTSGEDKQSNISSNEPNDSKEEDSLTESLSNIKLKTFEGINLLPTPREKPHNMVTRQDIREASPHCSLEMRNRSIIRVPPIRIGVKRKAVSSNEQIDRPPIKMYHSLAEKIYHFEKDTPPRFRTQKKGVRPSLAPTCSKPAVTVPLTPQLLSKNRTRACQVPSQEEREITFMEEMKKNPVKPVPLDRKIFDPPQLPGHSKQFTIPQPFNITDLKKQSTSKEEVNKSLFQFKGNDRPILKAVRPQGKGKLKVDLTGTIGLHEAQTNKKTVVQPFSFHDRDLEMAKKKEEKLKKLMEQENRYREFHANPVPSFISNHDTTNLSIASSTRSKYHHHESDPVLPFKAKSPSVLFKEPFRVKKAERPPLEPLNLELNTEKRASERREFDQRRKEREEEFMKAVEAMRQQHQEEMEQLSAELRKTTVHKPLPVPPYVRRKWRRRSRSLS